MKLEFDQHEQKIAAAGILILSQARLLEFSPKQFRAQPCHLIRIIEARSNFDELKFEDEFESIEEFKFDDSMPGEPIPTVLMTEEQAAQIVDAFERAVDAKMFIVHCRAGRSRSAAVAQAFAYFIGDGLTEGYIDTCTRWSPNDYVLGLLVKEIHRRKYGQP